MKSKDAVKWERAMQTEIEALHENDTYEFTNLSPDIKVVGRKWVSTEKKRWIMKINIRHVMLLDGFARRKN